MESGGIRNSRARLTRTFGPGAASLFVLLALPVQLDAQLSVAASKHASLFAGEGPVQLRLIADFGQLRDDRGADTPERPATVVLVDDRGNEVSIEAQLRTRGDFRLDASNCSYPPLRLNLKKKQTEGTVFDGQDKLKIVGSCRPNRDSYEQLVFLEYLAYRAFEVITDTSFRSRLARITYVDESGENDTFTRYAFFLEDDDALAERIGGEVFDVEEGRHLPAGLFDPVGASLVAIFQYMIGNTDWSDVAAHNTEILDVHGIALAIPYDFDFSGLVDAPYAIPDPSIGIRSVTERRYRGWCHADASKAAALERFRDAEADVIGLFETFPYLSNGERDRSVRYLRAFFEEIETDALAERIFLRFCRAIPTG